MREMIKRSVGILVILLGIGLYFYPEIRTRQLNRQSRREIEAFDATRREGDVTENADSEELAAPFSGFAEASPVDTEEQYRIREYNKLLYDSGQADFRDAWSVTQVPEEAAVWQEEMFGYIEIPAMDLQLPLYLGASEEHLAKGAAVLGATSIPIGGDNTNSVIAGHRGWRGAPYFLDIEELKQGDPVYITNPWETLTYRVESISIINPTDSDRVKIQEGKDMITLITCHPYRSHGKYRYAVYCVREKDRGVPEVVADRPEPETSAEEPAADQQSLTDESSASDEIQEEDRLRRGSALLILGMILATFFHNRKTNRERKRN